MANNRMYLLNRRLGIAVYIGKYYPSTGWHCRNETIYEDLDYAFSKDEHVSSFGPTDWEVEYEENSLDTVVGPVQIVKAPSEEVVS